MLKIKTKNGDSDFIIDFNVYHKRQNFRLFKSTKMGVNRPLELSKLDKSSLTLKEDHKTLDDVEKAIFRRSLLTSYPEAENVITTFDNNKTAEASTNTEHASCHRARNNSNVSLDPATDSKVHKVLQQVSMIVYPGGIRKYFFQDNGNILRCEIEGTKYCSKKGGSHGVNHVYYKYFFKENVLGKVSNSV